MWIAAGGGGGGSDERAASGLLQRPNLGGRTMGVSGGGAGAVGGLSGT